jgi:hypothetical protein
MCALNTKRRTLDQIERQLRTETSPAPSNEQEVLPRDTEIRKYYLYLSPNFINKKHL